MSRVIGAAVIDMEANVTHLVSDMQKVKKALYGVKRDTIKMKDSMHRAESSMKRSTSGIKNSIISMAKGFLVFKTLEATLGNIIRTGFKFNKNIEDSIGGLTALAVATSSNTSALGKHLNIMQKYNLASVEAKKTMQDLVKINAQTPYTLNQTAMIYKTMYASMKNVGASSKQMIELTEKLSIAAGAGQIEFRRLLAGVDGLATGTVLANSDLGRFITSLGLSNTVLKNSSNVVALILSKLKDFKVLDTMTVAISNLSNAWQQLTGEMTKSAFETSKQEIKGLTKFLNNNRDGLVIFTADVERAFDLLATRIDGYVVDIELAATKVAFYNAKIANAVTFGLSKKTKDNIKAYQTEIKILEKQSEILTNSYKKTRYELGMMPAELVRTLKNIGGGIGDSLVKKAKVIKKSTGASLKVWEDYYKRLGDIQTAWLVSDDRVKAYDNAILLGLKGADFDKYIKSYKDGFLDPLTKLKNKAAKKIDTYNIGRYLSNPLGDLKAINAQNDKKKRAYLDYYTSIGAYSSAWVLKEDNLRTKYAGLLSPDEIDNLVAKYKSDYFKPLENMSKTTASYMERIFDTMDKSLTNSFDNFFDYSSKGFMKFGDLASTVLHDVYMQIMRVSVINPLVGGIMGGITSLFTPTNVAPNLALSLKGYAHGDVFGATPFATGGAFTNSIISEPTPFAYGGSFGGNLGVMGEAGSEAVMPLTRVGNDLGVKSTPSNVIINIENQSGTAVDMKQISEAMSDDGTKTISIVMNALERNPDFRQAIKGVR
ncbi:MAG: phage tail tape measure protein [Epsilonproteobacteria bacterium]|nr:phage tail tape measure protein [Campylobacterota bacterium]